MELLRRTYDHIRPLKNTRSRRSIDWIGSGIKWFAGNPDSRDLKDIFDKLSRMTDNTNKLIDNNNDQMEIN